MTDPTRPGENTVSEQQSLAVRETTAIEPMPYAAAITSLASSVQIAPQWIAAKRAELMQAEAAVVALEGLYGRETFRLKQAVARRQLLLKVVKAMESGFVPIPRFSGHKLTDLDELPVSALVALDEAKARVTFDEVLFITGQAEGRMGRRRRSARDPLLVGVMRHAPMVIPGTDRGWGPQHHPGREEHFLIAWWRPEDERDEVMF